MKNWLISFAITVGGIFGVLFYFYLLVSYPLLYMGLIFIIVVVVLRKCLDNN